MFRDLRQALRMLMQSKGWTIVVLLSLALGIGVNTTLFSAINGLMIKTVAVLRPHELVRIRAVGDNQMRNSSSEYGYAAPKAGGQRPRSTFSYSVFQDLRDGNQTMTGMAACAPSGRVNVIVKGQAELASSLVASGSYLDVLGIPAFVGRTIGPDDDKPGAPPVAMLSYGYWNRRFGGDEATIGTSVTINSTPVTIVGVMPPSYSGIQRLGSQGEDILLPLVLDTQINERDRLSQPTYWWLQVVGRLKPGATAAQVEGNLNGVMQESARRGWSSYFSELSDESRGLSRNQNRSQVPNLDVASAARGIYDPSPTSARSISVLGVVVVMVLLIVCANVANLLLSRATLRRKEISIRLSIGANRRRLIRQLLTESVLVALLGGALAMLVAYWSRSLLPLGDPPPLDWRVFAFAGGISVLTGLTFGIIPALRATRVDLANSIKETSRSLSRSRTLLGKTLLIAQVAISLVLLIGAGLFLRTLMNLRNVDVGFKTANLLLVSVDPSVNRYDEEHSRRLVEQMKEAFQAIPGVRSVGMATPPLLSGSTWQNSMHVPGRPSSEDDDVHVMTVSPEFFETMQIPILMGRNFTQHDVKDAPQVALINEATAREFFGEGSPLGKRFGDSPEENDEYEVVGLVRDAKYASVRDDPPPTVYRTFAQTPLFQVTYLLRTGLEPMSVVPNVREAAHRVDPNLPLGNIRTQEDAVEERFSQERVFALAYALFGALALMLACIGLFGLMSYSVSRRTNEIGIRMALGAHRGGVVRMVLKESMLLVIIGSAIGVAGALAAGRLVASQLYDLAPTDPLTIVSVVVVMLVVSGIAGYLPARRASRLNPTVALHYE